MIPLRHWTKSVVRSKIAGLGTACVEPLYNGSFAQQLNSVCIFQKTSCIIRASLAFYASDRLLGSRQVGQGTGF